MNYVADLKLKKYKGSRKFVKKEFYSNGKLLISGEYLVLNGTLALAVPTKFGQRMEVEEDPAGENILFWKSFDQENKIWAEVQFSKDDLMPFRETLKTIDAEVFDKLQKILKECRRSNPAFLKNVGSTIVNNYLNFDRAWGLGSSSTLLSNLAQFANADALQLNKIVFGGSGYDIACARSGKPVFFRIDQEGPIYDSVNFSPPNPEQIFFIHLNQKQNSKTAVEEFLARNEKFEEEVEIISEISEALLFCDEFPDFMQLIQEHEEVIQFVLQEERIQTKLFPDFNGIVKSLGAWGGDFVMAASEMDRDEIINYFKQKNYPTILNYSDMVL